MRPQVHRIYLGNLSFATSQEDIKAFFLSKGVQVEVQHLSKPREEGQKSGGFAFITILGREAFEQALLLNLSDGPHGRKRLLVREAMPKPAGPQK